MLNSDRDSVNRKFCAEAGLVLFSSGASVIRPKDLYGIAQLPNMRALLGLSNIYFICRRRRISIDPYTLRVSNGRVLGDFRLHGEGPFNFERFSFVQSVDFSEPGKPISPIREVRCENSFGYVMTALHQSGCRNNIPAHVLISNSTHKLGSYTDLEVLYIGQAYGKDGARLAPDRLSSHTTLQKVMAEALEDYPNHELLILMFKYEHSKNLASTAGDFSVEPTASQAEELEHLQRIPQLIFDRKIRINLAEAGLINYFKPHYNIQHRDSFSRANKYKLQTLTELFKKDMTALIVEVNTSNLKNKLFSAHASAKSDVDVFGKEIVDRWADPAFRRENKIDEFVTEMTHVHFAKFALYDKAVRETFLHSLPW